MEFPVSDVSGGLSKESLKQAIVDKLLFAFGKDPVSADKHAWLEATLLVVRDQLVESWLCTERERSQQASRKVCYLSMEFLTGRTLSNALLSLGLYHEVREALESIGLDFNELVCEERDPGLGNGGLGRLAACFLDSLATLGLPGCGYGIRYDYGMFRQTIVNGQQQVLPDYWLEYGNPWEFERHTLRYRIRFGGTVRQDGEKITWVGGEETQAIACDQIIPGYGTNSTSTLRLWRARACNEINLAKFNKGDYHSAIESKNDCENISRILYPDDSTCPGQELRLRQEYFLVSATLQDILTEHYQKYKSFEKLADKTAIHLNDTHPVLAIPELLRLLIDEYNYGWNDAFEICCQIFSYTNHTLMDEALETWPVEMMSKILPRHLQLILQINDYFLKLVQEQYPGDIDLLRRVSLIDEAHGRRVRMAWLAVVVSHKVNGVSELHSRLMVESLFSDFARIFPARFCNITNGVTPRRWLALANPDLSALLDKNIGRSWRVDLAHLSKLEKYLNRPEMSLAAYQVKLANKQRLAEMLAQQLNVIVNPEALFDVQVKRIHEYKRQLLNVLHIITRYNRIKSMPDADWVPRVFILAGKAAPAYYMANHIIHLINDVAAVINQDIRTNDKIKVVFVPDYGVSWAQLIIPAADLSEQISLAGTEASGTSNMKFALNGALTIGTLDGANIEMLDYVGIDNMFIFGHTSKEVDDLRREGYVPQEYYQQDEELHQVLTQIANGLFNPDAPERYRNLVGSLVHDGDYYQVLADYRSYVDTQDNVDSLYRDSQAWISKSMRNVASMGYFSSDRTVREYAEKIWFI